MDKKILVNYDFRVNRVAVLEDGRLVELYVERPLQHRVVGNIYKGVVKNVLRGMEAAFVDIGLERNAFLYISEVIPYWDEIDQHPQSRKTIDDMLRVDDEIMVQVTKEPFGQKGARLTEHITLPGRYLVLVPGAEYVGVSRRIENLAEKERLRRIADSIRPLGNGIIVRTVAEGACEKTLEQDLHCLLLMWQRVQRKFNEGNSPAAVYHDLALTCRVARDLLGQEVSAFLLDNIHEYEKVQDILETVSAELRDKVEFYNENNEKIPIFEKYGIETEIKKALERQVWLDCGGYLIIDEVEALTVIDVNTGRYTGSKSLAETVYKTNLEAAEEIARQIRLRDIGGIIVVDFIDMSNEEHRQEVLRCLGEAVKKDRLRTYILGLTNLGLVEMTRKKVRKDLAAFLQQSCSYCSGTGRVLTPVVVCINIEKELKKTIPAMSEEAFLIEVHPEVAAMLIGTGGGNLKKLEDETGKHLFIRGNEHVHLEDHRLTAAGSRTAIERAALPVVEGELLTAMIEEPHASSPGHGIARHNGFVLDVIGGDDWIGQTVKIQITEVNRTFARAVIVN